MTPIAPPANRRIRDRILPGLVHLRERLLAVPLPARWSACAVYLVLVAGLSLAPSVLFPPTVTSIPGADKVVHFFMYGGLGALLRWALAGGATSLRCRLALAGALAYGLAMEILQSAFTDGMRAFGWDDMAANAAGAFLFWALAAWWLASPRAPAAAPRI